MLCSNRPEGFGPHSSIHPSVPTTCFDQTILIPLPTWIYLLFIPGFVFAFSIRRRTKTTRSHKILAGLYYFLLICMIAMQSLEIARLVQGALGIGLLPFTYVGVIEAAVVQFLAEPAKHWVRGVTAVYWLFLAVVMGVTVASLRDEEGPYNRRGTQINYPLGDEVTDLSVMVGVAFLLAVLQPSMMLTSRASSKAVDAGDANQDGIAQEVPKM